MDSKQTLIASKNFESNEKHIHHDKFQIEKKKDDREKWSNKTEFFFALMGFAIGLGNVWRFPYLCYKNGGGAFMIAYYVGVIFCGIPMFFLEVIIGQFSGQSGPNTWDMAPMFKGVGYGMTVMVLLANLYYVILLVWTLYYLFNSFNINLPWASCDNSWNTNYCVTLNPNQNETLFNHTKIVSSADEFWKYNVLNQSESFNVIGDIRWELLICLALSWIIIFFCLFKGIKWTGKISYFTSTFPFFLMAIMLVRGVTLEGSFEGIKYLFIPDWNHLKSSEVWIDAITQALYKYGIGLNTATTLGSFNHYKTDSYKQVLLLSAISETVAIVSGLIIFSVLGFMANITGQNIEDVAAGGVGLAFVAYPNALTQLPMPYLWSSLFFLMIIFVVLDTQFCCVEAFITACTDIWPKLRKNRMLFLFMNCLISFFIGIIFVTQGGIYWFDIFNTYSCAGWALLGIVFFECIAISYGYGSDRFYQNIKDMVGYYPGKFWKYSWSVITPGICVLVFVYSIFKFEGTDYPLLGELLGWTLAFSSVLCIPIYAIYYKTTRLAFFKKGKEVKTATTELI